jgi:hypothetical protein
MALERERGDGVFPLHEQRHGKKPQGQGQLGVGEERHGAQRGLVTAVPTLHRLARAQRREVLGLPAIRADEARRPAPAEQGVGALRLGSVLRKQIRKTQTLLKLDEVLGHGADSRRW